MAAFAGHPSETVRNEVRRAHGVLRDGTMQARRFLGHEPPALKVPTLAEAWARFCAREAADNVITLPRPAALG